jgi:hypothetical protein
MPRPSVATGTCARSGRRMSSPSAATGVAIEIAVDGRCRSIVRALRRAARSSRLTVCGSREAARPRTASANAPDHQPVTRRTSMTTISRQPRSRSRWPRPRSRQAHPRTRRGWGINGAAVCGAGGIAIGGTAGAFGSPLTAAAGATIGGTAGVVACGVGGAGRRHERRDRRASSALIGARAHERLQACLSATATSLVNSERRCRGRPAASGCAAGRCVIGCESNGAQLGSECDRGRALVGSSSKQRLSRPPSTPWTAGSGIGWFASLRRIGGSVYGFAPTVIS